VVVPDYFTGRSNRKKSTGETTWIGRCPETMNTFSRKRSAASIVTTYSARASRAVATTGLSMGSVATKSTSRYSPGAASAMLLQRNPDVGDVFDGEWKDASNLVAGEDVDHLVEDLPRR